MRSGLSSDFPDAAKKWLLVSTATSILVGGLLTVLVLSLAGRVGTAAHLAEIGRIVFTLGILAAALLMLLRWRFLDEPAAGWTAAFLIISGGYLRTEEMHQAVFVSSAVRRSVDLVLPTDMLLLLLLMWVCLCAARRIPTVGWRNPLVVGVGIGVLLNLTRAGWFTYAPELPDTWVVPTVLTVYVATTWVGARAFLRLTEFATEARLSAVICVVAGTATHHFSPTDLSNHAVWAAIVFSVCSAAGVTVALTAFQLVWSAYTEQAQRMARLDERASLAEARLQQDEEWRHEARSTVAGINSASRLLISANDRIPEAQRTSLQHLLEGEMARLEEMLLTPESERSEHVAEVDLDDLLARLVLLHTARGATIDCATVGTTVQAPPAQVSLAINTVLSNTRRHAPGAKVTISAEVRPEHVALHLADDGPGVPSQLRSRLFSRYVKDADSVGEGVGLHSARRALRDAGGDLLLDPEEQGACFTILLPRPPC